MSAGMLAAAIDHHGTMPALLLLQLVSTLPMAGLIWFVQVVHYPLFKLANKQSFAAIHATRTTYVVAPLMLVELASSLALLRPQWRTNASSTGEACGGAALVCAIWLSTALVQVPLHNRLQARHSMRDAQQLIATNWVRTVAWTLRAALVLLWTARGLQVAADVPGSLQ